MIKLENKKLYDLLKEKDELISRGRHLSHQIDKVNKKLKAFEDKEAKITEKVKCEDLSAQGDVIVKEINERSKKLEAIADQIREEKLKAIPEKMATDHRALIKEKDEMELERNKVGLKVQKIKDRAIPLIQKEVKPLLKDKFDDIESAKLLGGKIVINTFNHLKEFEAHWDKRNK